MFWDDLFDDPFSWREDCEDGFEFGVDPEDYETEEEYEEALTEAKYAWREDCEDGTEFDVDLEDYETEEEYEEALTEAKYAWREDCEDGTEFGVDPEDYETEEEYEEALEEAKEQDEPSDTIEFTVSLEFANEAQDDDEQEEDLDGEIARAASAHFGLSAPHDRGIVDIIKQVMKEDVSRAVEIWRWCVKNYTAKVDVDAIYQDIFLHCKLYPQAFWEEVVKAIAQHPDFCTGLFRDVPCEPPRGAVLMLAELAMEISRPAVARDVTLASLANPRLEREDAERLIDLVMTSCCHGKDRDIVECFRDEVYPAIRQFCDGRFPEKLARWDRLMEVLIKHAHELGMWPETQDIAPSPVPEAADVPAQVDTPVQEVAAPISADEEQRSKETVAATIAAQTVPRLDKSTKSGLLLAAVLGSVLAIFVGVLCYMNAVKEWAMEDVKAEAEAICAEYGLRDVEVSVFFAQIYEGYEEYHMNVQGNGAYQLGYEKRFELVEKLDDIRIDRKDSLILPFLTFDGSKYRLDTWDYRKLEIDGTVVYVDMTDEERETLKRLRSSMPYEGMSEKYIDKTALGKHDYKEGGKYWDQPSGQYLEQTTYKWHDAKGNVKAVATVRGIGRWSSEKRITSVKIYNTGNNSAYQPSATKKPKATAKPDDPYDVYDYYDPEDFYYDHPDDFFDYYDAEDYFYDHVD